MSVSQFIDAMDGTKTGATRNCNPGRCLRYHDGYCGAVRRCQQADKIIAGQQEGPALLALIITMLGYMLLGMALPTVCSLRSPTYCSDTHWYFPGESTCLPICLSSASALSLNHLPPVCLASLLPPVSRGQARGRPAGRHLPMRRPSDPLCLRVPSGSSAAGIVTERVVVNTAMLAYGIIFLMSGIASYMFVPIKNVVGSVFFWPA